MGGWIGVDFDGTLAVYDGWKGEKHLGEPVPKMVERVRRWLDKGITVKIFTARVSHDDKFNEEQRRLIQAWCLKYIGQELAVTNAKDFGMFELWDDRAVQVIPNTGERVRKEQ